MIIPRASRDVLAGLNAAGAAPYVLMGLLVTFCLLVALVIHLANHDERNKK